VFPVVENLAALMVATTVLSKVVPTAVHLARMKAYQLVEQMDKFLVV